MKKIFGVFILFAALFAAFSCENVTPQPEGPILVLGDGPVDLVDQEFGMYYGDKRNNETGVYSIVLSDAICFRDGYGNPYLDSEGDMLVLEFNAKLDGDESVIMLPAGEYVVGAEGSADKYVNVASSYVKRLVANTSYHYNLVSGSISVARNTEGGYDIMTNDLVLSKGGELFDVLYSYNGNIKFEEWSKVAVGLQGVGDDITDMPFTEVSAIYYGNLFGYGTGNYVLQFGTDGFMDDETGTVPGLMLVMNMFGDLIAKDNVILLEEGTYTVYPSFNSSKFSMLYGMDMSGMPFGTYAFQQDAKGSQSLEYIGEGTVDVKREQKEYNDVYTLTYEFKTAAKRTIKGTWVGQLEFMNAAEDSGRIALSTLDGPVDCDMQRVKKAGMSHIETLRTMDTKELIADVWQLCLEPSLYDEEGYPMDWTAINAANPNGDAMYLEFVVPLNSYGDIAPEINTEYTYQIQPNLSMDEELYIVSTSRMGRPYDDIFYEPNWTDYTYMTGLDARRGFTWDGGYRGNWYLHYAEYTWQNLDEMAPMVKGTVTVKRTSELVPATRTTHHEEWQNGVLVDVETTRNGREAEFTFVWDLYDDSEASYNVSGEWTGPVFVGASSGSLPEDEDDGGDFDLGD